MMSSRHHGDGAVFRGVKLQVAENLREHFGVMRLIHHQCIREPRGPCLHSSMSSWRETTCLGGSRSVLDGQADASHSAMLRLSCLLPISCFLRQDASPILDFHTLSRRQDRLWALPVFKSPASSSTSPEPFRLLTAFLGCGDLLEGKDSVCTQMQVRETLFERGAR